MNFSGPNITKPRYYEKFGFSLGIRYIRVELHQLRLSQTKGIFGHIFNSVQGRIKSYMTRAKEIEQAIKDKEKAPKVNKFASSRLVKSALWSIPNKDGANAQPSADGTKPEAEAPDATLAAKQSLWKKAHRKSGKASIFKFQPSSYRGSPVTRLVPVGLDPPHPRRSTDRDLPRTNGVGVALAFYATVYRSECPQGPEWPPKES